MHNFWTKKGIFKSPWDCKLLHLGVSFSRTDVGLGSLFQLWLPLRLRLQNSEKLKPCPLGKCMILELSKWAWGHYGGLSG